MKMAFTFALVFCGLSACAAFPELEGQQITTAQNAAYPQLVPLAPIVARADALGTQAITAGPPASRIAALRARANRLRGPIIDSNTRTRMTQGVNTRGL